MSIQREDNPDKNPDVEAIKSSLRRAMGASGPLHLPEHFKLPNKVYRFETYSKRKPFQFRQALELGYTYVKPSEMPGLVDELEGADSRFIFSNDDSRISIILNNDETAYLLCIDRDRFNLLQEVKLEESREIKESMTQKHINSRDNHYGSIQFTKDK